jgi:hypothetical protein
MKRNFPSRCQDSNPRSSSPLPSPAELPRLLQKYWYSFATLHGVTTQKTWTWFFVYLSTLFQLHHCLHCLLVWLTGAVMSDCSHRIFGWAERNLHLCMYLATIIAKQTPNRNVISNNEFGRITVSGECDWNKMVSCHNMGYGLDERCSRVRFPTRVGNFSVHHRVQNGSEAHPVCYPMGTRGSFPGSKAAGAWCWPLTSI